MEPGGASSIIDFQSPFSRIRFDEKKILNADVLHEDQIQQLSRWFKPKERLVLSLRINESLQESLSIYLCR